MKLSEIRAGQVLSGILLEGPATVISVQQFGDSVIELTYKNSLGKLANELIYEDREDSISLLQTRLPWTFMADSSLFRLVSEAYRIRLAYLFDPQLAVHTSMVEPLPHQITAVYGEMLQRHPLRYLLADDPGAGKTIMTGLLIKELIIRGDLKRCLIVTPGNLSEQWQDELDKRFGLHFEILTNDRLEAARSGNAFQEMPYCIARMDKLSRNVDIQEKLRVTDWDLIVCDEAHKMSATLFGREVKYTKRYILGQLLSTITRHFLLLTATPHNGKEADFQLFMALLDGDRFEGKFRPGQHTSDVSDLMRRMVKEDLLKFDGTPLFPERLAYTVNYSLSDPEAVLYAAVTRYVREEFNRADKLNNEGRKNTVGFALTILQRRLASSPEAIYQSLRRRKERLERRLDEEKLQKRGSQQPISANDFVYYAPEDLDDIDDLPENEQQETEEAVVDQATAARTIAELEVEIAQLAALVQMALKLKNSGQDRKWDELSQLLQDDQRMFGENHSREKLIIFTEHRDTLDYLTERVRSLLGREDAVVTIQGGMLRDDRRKVQEKFTQDINVRVLIATDAAGEGINLQRAHLMINYDLPWNPNRLEQRFGRIHRIGQTEVCHLWNLVASETREGEVFQRLFLKLEEEKKALGGRVFDVLGKVKYEDSSLRELLIQAIRYGDQPEVRARLNQVVDRALNTDQLRLLLEEGALATDSMDLKKVFAVREEMERIEARRLQPHFIEAFFKDSLTRFKGTLREKESGRYEITFVPQEIRNRDRVIGTGDPVLRSYERVCFEKEKINLPGKPLAALICPGHPLLDSILDLALERYRSLLKQGAVLIDETGRNSKSRVLFYIENMIQNAKLDQHGNRTHVSEQVHFVELDENGNAVDAGDAPYLDYRPPVADEIEAIQKIIAESEWLKQDLENQAILYSIQNLVPKHFSEVHDQIVNQIDHIMVAVKDRLKREINYWDHRAEDLKLQERAGKPNAKLNSQQAEKRAEELQIRLSHRIEELGLERQLIRLPPVVIGGAFIIPAELIRKGNDEDSTALFAHETKKMESAAMNAVMKFECELGFIPIDVSIQNIGYDIESKGSKDGTLRFIEVKGRVKGSTIVTVTKNEIITALNKPEGFIFALVEVDEDHRSIYYLQHPFTDHPDFGATSVNYSIKQLLDKATLVAKKEY